MEKKHFELIKFLEEKESWTTSSELAKYFNCTTRTIRNRITEINKKFNNLIISSNEGYTIKEKAISNSLITNDSLMAQIFLELIKNIDSTVDIFDLSEIFFVSESTILDNIYKLRKVLKNQPIEINIENNNIKLKGSENATRRFLVSLLYSENNLFENIKNSATNLISDIPLDDIEDIVLKVINMNELFVNQYRLENIVLHLVVSITRIQEGNIVSKSITKDNIFQKLEKERTLAQEVVCEISKKFDIVFPENEIDQLALQFIGLNSLNAENSTENHINPKIITMLEKILRQTKEVYLIDFNDEVLVERLALHVQGLNLRANFNNYTRNSSLWEIKINYPIIYDMSVYIASQLQKKLNIVLNEDEIAFISIHLGSYLEGKYSENNFAVKILIIVDDYQNLRKTLTEKISKSVPDFVYITSTSEFSPKNIDDFDLIISSHRRHIVKYPGAILVKTFLTQKDLEKINNRIKLIYNSKIKQKMLKLLDDFIPNEIYINQFDSEGFNKSDLIALMYNKMNSEGYAENDFYEGILVREDLAPTSFPSGIAIPHPIELKGKKNGISILTLQQSIKWSTQDVNMVAMVSIDKNDAKEFNSFFELFIDIMSSKYNIEKLTNCDGFEEFILKLRGMINEKLDEGYENSSLYF